MNWYKASGDLALKYKYDLNASDLIEEIKHIKNHAISLLFHIKNETLLKLSEFIHEQCWDLFR